MEHAPRSYRAFISYSHSDDGVARWLHKKLEGYVVPSSLVGKSTPMGAVPPRLFPVFLDREEIPTSADLGGTIRKALEHSQCLIVICSPKAAQSRWVDAEIRGFKELHGESRIIGLIVAGEPNASDQPTAAEQECFPPGLRFRMGPEGQLTDERTEPIAADIRLGHDTRTIAFQRLLAGVLGVDFDTLRGRETIRRRRRLLVTGIVSASLLAVMVVLLAMLISSRQQEDNQRAIAAGSLLKEGEQRQIAAEKTALAEEKTKLAVVKAKEADEEREMKARSKYVSDIQQIQRLWDENNIARAVELLDRNVPQPGSEDYRGVEWYWWRTRVRSPGVSLSLKGVARSIAFSPDGRSLAATDETGRVRVWDLQTYSQRFEQEIGDGAGVLDSFHHQPKTWFNQSVAFSPDGSMVAATCCYSIRENGGVLEKERVAALRVWDAKNAKELCSIRNPPSSGTTVVFSPDGRSVVAGGRADDWIAYDPSTGAVQTKSNVRSNNLIPTGVVRRLVFQRSRLDPGRQLLLTLDSDGTATSWRMGEGARLTQKAPPALQPREPWDLIGGQEDQLFALRMNLGHVEFLRLGDDAPAMKVGPRAKNAEIVRLEPPQRGSVTIAVGKHKCASQAGNGIICVWDLNQKNIEFASEIRGFHSAYGMAFSPNGESLALAEHGSIRIISISQSPPLTIPAMASGTADRDASLSDASQLKCSWNQQDLPQGNWSFVSIDPTGHRLALADGKELGIFDLELRQWLYRTEGNCRDVTFDPVGRFVIFQAEPLIVYDLQIGQPVKTDFGSTSGQLSFFFSDDGYRLYVLQTGQMLGGNSRVDLDVYYTFPWSKLCTTELSRSRPIGENRPIGEKRKVPSRWEVNRMCEFLIREATERIAEGDAIKAKRMPLHDQPVVAAAKTPRALPKRETPTGSGTKMGDKSVKTAMGGRAVAPPPTPLPVPVVQDEPNETGIGAAKEGNYVSRSTGMKFKLIPAGNGVYGEVARQKEITIDKPFYLGVCTVTKSQWQAVMGTTPWLGRPEVKEDPDCPAHVTWPETHDFCQRLSEKDGVTYRLPREVEWEYACRAGTTTRYSFGDDERELRRYAWFENNTKNDGAAYAHKVGTKLPNPWGFYDMHGNVRQWCEDLWPGEATMRVTRGGGWRETAGGCQSTSRFGNPLANHGPNVGFRIIASPPSPGKNDEQSPN